MVFKESGLLLCKLVEAVKKLDEDRTSLIILIILAKVTHSLMKLVSKRQPIFLY